MFAKDLVLLEKFSYKLDPRLTPLTCSLVLLQQNYCVVLYLVRKEDNARFGGGEGWWQMTLKGRGCMDGWVGVCVCLCVCA